MNIQNNNRQPDTRRSQVLLILWHNLPRVALICILLIIIALMVTCSRKKSRLEEEKAASRAQDRKPVNTVLLELQPATIQDAINLPGIIEPWIRLELMAKVNGSIIEVLVQEGSVVEQGQILARIEPDDYRIALVSANAAYTFGRFWGLFQLKPFQQYCL